MREPLPLATVQDAVLEFLRDREDAVVFGAQAVNAYVGEPRMTQDVRMISPRAAELVEELREYSQKFPSPCGLEKRRGRGYRCFRCKGGQQSLVDLRRLKTFSSGGSRRDGEERRNVASKVWRITEGAAGRSRARWRDWRCCS